MEDGTRVEEQPRRDRFFVEDEPKVLAIFIVMLGVVVCAVALSVTWLANANGERGARVKQAAIEACESVVQDQRTECIARAKTPSNRDS